MEECYVCGGHHDFERFHENLCLYQPSLHRLEEFYELAIDECNALSETKVKYTKKGLREFGEEILQEAEGNLPAGHLAVSGDDAWGIWKSENDNAIEIDGGLYEIDKVDTAMYLPMISCGKLEFYVARDNEEAGAAAREYWNDMATNDPREFTSIVGEERLVQWALGRGDECGCCSLDDFLDAVEDVPEEEFANYDGKELEVSGLGIDLEEDLGFVPTVAYRHN